MLYDTRYAFSHIFRRLSKTNPYTELTDKSKQPHADREESKPPISLQYVFVMPQFTQTDVSLCFSASQHQRGTGGLLYGDLTV